MSWVTCARRPLSTSEAQHAIAVEIGASQLGFDDICRVDDMITFCNGWVTADEEGGLVRQAH